MIVIGKNSLKIKFNKQIKMKNSFVYGIVLMVSENDYLLAMVTMANRQSPQDKWIAHETQTMSKTLVQKGKILQLANQKSVQTCESCALTNCTKTQTKRRRMCSKTPAREVAVNWHQPSQELKLWQLAVLVVCHQWCNGFQFQLICPNKRSDVASNDFAYKRLAQLRKNFYKEISVQQLGWEHCLPSSS